jgi:hypothetical protein
MPGVSKLERSLSAKKRETKKKLQRARSGGGSGKSSEAKTRALAKQKSASMSNKVATKAANVPDCCKCTVISDPEGALPPEVALTVSKKKGGIALRELVDGAPKGQVAVTKTLKMIKWGLIKAIFMPVPDQVGDEVNKSKQEVVHKNQIYVEIAKTGTLVLECEKSFVLRSMVANALPAEGHDLVMYTDFCYDDNPLACYDDTRATLFKAKIVKSSAAHQHEEEEKEEKEDASGKGAIAEEEQKKGKVAHEASVARKKILSDVAQLPEICTLQAQSRGLLVRGGAAASIQELVIKRIGWGEITRAFAIKTVAEDDGDDTFTYDFSIKSGAGVCSNYTISIHENQVLEFRSACRKKCGQDDSTRLDYDPAFDVHAEFLAEYDALVALYRPGWNALFGYWFWTKLQDAQLERTMPEKPKVTSYEKKNLDVDYWEEDDFGGCGTIMRRTPYAVKVVKFEPKKGGTKNTAYTLQCLVEGNKAKMTIVRTMQEIAHLYSEMPHGDLEHEKFHGKDFPSVSAKDSEIKRGAIANWLIAATALTREHQLSETFVAAYMMFLGLSGHWKPEEDSAHGPKMLLKQKSFAVVKDKKSDVAACQSANHAPTAKVRRKTKQSIMKVDDSNDKMISELNKVFMKWDKFMDDEVSRRGMLRLEVAV